MPLPGVEIKESFGIIHVDVKKPKHLCLPVDKNGESPGAETHADHLICYQLKQVKTEPKFVKVTGVFVNNQFGSETLDVKKPSELCVPAMRIRWAQVGCRLQADNATDCSSAIAPD